MRVAFLAADKQREQMLADAFLRGVRAHGDDGEIRAPGLVDADVACMVGVKSREAWEANRRAGVRVVMLDKGYLRHAAPGLKCWEYWRVSVGSHHPAMRDWPTDRLDRLGLYVKPWRAGRHVLIAGSSAKYHAFHGLPDPTTWAEMVVDGLRKVTSRPIVYRPKPSWHGARPIAGAGYSDGPLVLDGAHVLVTHGSNACFEAVLAGVPCIVLGQGVARAISSTSLEDADAPRRASEVERRQWLAHLAYHQWTLPEFASGEAWAAIRPQLG